MQLLTSPINLEEQEALVELREKLGDLKLYDSADHFLLRWLRARDLDVKKARKMLEAHLKWRDTFPALSPSRTLAFQPSEVITNNVKVKFLGYDEMGRLVIFLPMGCYNFKNIFDAGEKDAFEVYCHCLLDKVLKILEEQRKSQGATQLIAIVDLKDLSFQQVTYIEGMQFCLSFGKVFEANYPELLYRGVVINAPWVFPYAFNILKPIITERTLGKISIYNSNAKQYKPVLHEILPKEIIPKTFGGDGFPIDLEI